MTYRTDIVVISSLWKSAITMRQIRLMGMFIWVYLMKRLSPIAIGVWFSSRFWDLHCSSVLCGKVDVRTCLCKTFIHFRLNRSYAVISQAQRYAESWIHGITGTREANSWATRIFPNTEHRCWAKLWTRIRSEMAQNKTPSISFFFFIFGRPSP